MKAIFILLIFFQILQWVIVLAKVHEDEYKYRSDFFISMIPGKFIYFTTFLLPSKITKNTRT